MSTTLSQPPAPHTVSSPDAGAKPQPASIGRLIASGLSNLIVFSLLASILYAGHHTGWKLPRWSALFGSAVEPENKGDWCAEHAVPEAQCIECNTDLLPKVKEFGFCRIHGVAECVICHPELAQVSGEPKLPQYDTAAAIALIARGENNSKNELHKRRVQFASVESIAKAGIDVDVVGEQSVTEFISTNGELTFDPTRVAHLSPRVGGTIAAVFKTLGDTVSAGEILALVEAAQVGQAKSQLLSSVVQAQLRKTNLERMQKSSAVLPERSLTEAETALKEAEIALITARQALVNLGFELPEQLAGRDAKQLSDEFQFLGIPEKNLAALPPGGKTANLIAIHALTDGVIVTADVVAGEVVDKSQLLYTVADPSRLWLILSVRQEDARYAEPGLRVVFRTDDGAAEVTGKISWVSPAIDEQTRTLQVRVNLEQSDRKLRDKTFGTGKIILREEPHAIVVPREAVQSTNDAHFVFVRDKNYFKEGSPKFFHVRQVRVGARKEGSVELLAGVLPGEVVATKGSAVILAQLLRANLGAGCGCHE